MIKFYINMIKLGRITIEEVPPLWQDEVKKAIDSNNPDFHTASEIIEKAQAYDIIVEGDTSDSN